MEHQHSTRTTCRICGSRDLKHVFTLGDHYISDFVEPGKAYDGPKCPIELVVCNNCTLVQNPHTAPQELLYSRHYWYRSGVTDTMREALADVVGSAIAMSVATGSILKNGDVVLDIGSNDGTLLRQYPDWVIKVGVEPATNLAEEGSREIQILINDFWSENLYWAACGDQKAKIITAIGMFYDLDDPNQFIADIAKVLHPEGIFIAQLMCLQNMINCSDIGNLAHEHLEFYTLESLAYLLGQYDLEIFDIETVPVNGQSYRLYIRHDTGKPITQRVAKAFDAEKDILTQLTSFLQRIDVLRQEIYQTLIELVYDDKKTVWVYGASTKGNTLLQWIELDERTITGAAERSPEKWGKITAGSNIPIVSEVEARKYMPDYFLVLPYAFIGEFMEREKNQDWRLAGGKFIVPLPELRII